MFNEAKKKIQVTLNSWWNFQLRKTYLYNSFNLHLSIQQILHKWTYYMQGIAMGDMN